MRLTTVTLGVLTAGMLTLVPAAAAQAGQVPPPTGGCGPLVRHATPDGRLYGTVRTCLHGTKTLLFGLTQVVLQTRENCRVDFFVRRNGGSIIANQSYPCPPPKERRTELTFHWPGFCPLPGAYVAQAHVTYFHANLQSPTARSQVAVVG